MFSCNKSNQEKLEISWCRPKTATITSFKVRWHPIEDRSNVLEEIVHIDGDDMDLIKFSFPFEKVVINTAYKVNIYSMATSCGMTKESYELHGKFIFNSETEIADYVEE